MTSAAARNPKLRGILPRIAYASACALLAAAPALGEVRVFVAGDPAPAVHAIDDASGDAEAAKVTESMASPEALDSAAGALAARVRTFVSRHPGIFPVPAADEETLKLKRSHSDSAGVTLRFIQSRGGVEIEGAELVANLSIDGKLATVNSSLADTTSVGTTPTVTREQALEAARAHLLAQRPAPTDPSAPAQPGFDDVSGEKDGLRVTVRRSGAAFLVWQIRLRDLAGGRDSAVQVIARGPRAGAILRTLADGTFAGAAGPITIRDIGLSGGTRLSLRRLPRIGSGLPDWGVSLPPIFPFNQGELVIDRGRPVVAPERISPEAQAAFQNLERVRVFYKGYFGRDSYDGRGAPIEASVNGRMAMLSFLSQNAAWISGSSAFLFGVGGDEMRSMTHALDIVGHEFTHAVIDSTSSLVYEGQSGALNEHFADVMGAIIEKELENPANPFLNGDSILTEKGRAKAIAIRDLEHPERGMRPQPATVGEIAAEFGPECQAGGGNDQCGVHTLSGIPNRVAAAILTAQAWSPQAYGLFYRVMTARLRSNSDFADYRAQAADACRHEADIAEADCAALEVAFDDAGI